jgi:hypothetical protein
MSAQEEFNAIMDERRQTLDLVKRVDAAMKERFPQHHWSATIYLLEGMLTNAIMELPKAQRLERREDIVAQLKLHSKHWSAE